MNGPCKYMIEHKNPAWTVCIWEDGYFNIDSVMPVGRDQLKEILKIVNAVSPKSMEEA